jgi:DNA-binding response OmpR family regulator
MREEMRDLGERKRIVIGTLDYTVIRALGRRFHRNKFDLRTCQRGVDVLIEILDNDVDLLILDVDVTGALGMEMMSVIRRIRPRLPVILVTDDYTHQIRKVAAEQGITYQVFKPMSEFESDAIMQVTEMIIEKNQTVGC